jgi:hypothetical protein
MTGRRNGHRMPSKVLVRFRIVREDTQISDSVMRYLLSPLPMMITSSLATAFLNSYKSLDLLTPASAMIENAWPRPCLALSKPSSLKLTLSSNKGSKTSLGTHVKPGISEFFRVIRLNASIIRFLRHISIHTSSELLSTQWRSSTPLLYAATIREAPPLENGMCIWDL